MKLIEKGKIDRTSWSADRHRVAAVISDKFIEALSKLSGRRNQFLGKSVWDHYPRRVGITLSNFGKKPKVLATNKHVLKITLTVENIYKLWQ